MVVVTSARQEHWQPDNQRAHMIIKLFRAISIFDNVLCAVCVYDVRVVKHRNFVEKFKMLLLYIWLIILCSEIVL